jgi:hypothetical protein
MALSKTISTPTDIYMPERAHEENQGFHHLLPRFRQGKISFERFAKVEVRKIPIDSDVELELRLADEMPKKGRRKKAENAVSVSETEAVHVGEASEDRPQVDKEVRKQAEAKKAQAIKKRKKAAKPKGDK